MASLKTIMDNVVKCSNQEKKETYETNQPMTKSTTKPPVKQEPVKPLPQKQVTIQTKATTKRQPPKISTKQPVINGRVNKK